VVPQDLLALFTAEEMENLICGSRTVNVSVLQRIAVCSEGMERSSK